MLRRHGWEWGCELIHVDGPGPSRHLVSSSAGEPPRWLHHHDHAALFLRPLSSAAPPPPKPAEKNGGVFVQAVGSSQGKSSLLLGLANNLQRIGSVGYFSPIAADAYHYPGAAQTDRHVELMRTALNIKTNPKHMVGVSRLDAFRMLGGGAYDELLERILNAYLAYKETCDVVVVGGTELGPTFQTLDAKIASELGTPVLVAVDAHQRPNPSSVLNDINMTIQNLRQEKASILGVMLNRLSDADRDVLLPTLPQRVESLQVPYLGHFPEDSVMSSLRLDEIAAMTNASLTAGLESDMTEEVSKTLILATGSTSALRRIQEATRLPERLLLVTEADRSDLLFALMAARSVRRASHVSGILVSGTIDPLIQDILHNQSASTFTLPILQTALPIDQIMERIQHIEPDILPSSQLKIAQASALFDKHVNIEKLATLLRAPVQRDYVNPKLFQHTIVDKCRKNKQRIVLPEGTDKRILRAAAETVQRGLAEVTILGKPEEVHGLAAQIGVDLGGCRVIHPTSSDRFESYVKAMLEARKGKGLAEQHVRDQLSAETVFGVMMVHQGDADGMVSGASHTTADTVRPALQLLGIKDEQGKNKLVSSVFFMLLPDKVLVYGDCAVNVNPTSEELAQIGLVSAQTASAFGIEPRVAMLSYATLGKRDQILQVDGPFQYDAAVDPNAARVKIKTPSTVAGRANVLIFPDLNAGNVGYKAVQQSTGAIAMGPVLQGLRLPVNDLSRGCTVADIVNTIVVTSVQAIDAKAQMKQQ